MENFDTQSPLLGEIFTLHGKWRAQKEAVICGDERLSWTQFTANNHLFANALLDKKIQRGDRIAIVMCNGIPMLQAMMGALSMGAVSVPINLSVNDDGLLNMLTDAEVKALVVSEDQFDRIMAIEHQLPESIELKITTGNAPLSWINFNEFTASANTDIPACEVAEQDLLNIIYSSGTTGMPKGIVHTQGGRRDWAYDLAIALRYHGNSRTLLTIGLYSNISWVAMLTTLLAGGTLVISRHFTADGFLRLVEQEKITHTAMVPVQFQRVVEQLEECPDSWNISSMQAMMSCGSPLHADLKKRIFDHFACGIIELYGLTEGVITTIDPEESEGRWSSVGKPLIGTDIRIIGDDDAVLPPGESGELVSIGRITMPGYLNRPEATTEATYVDELGRRWLRTGDIGYADKEGFLYIVDRKKDMILSGGQNVYPQDIEAIVVNHPAVSEVAVIPAKSERWGETPIALVVRNKNAIEDAQEIKAWANQQLGKQQRIADVLFIEELPRNPNGKVLKRELRAQYANKHYA